MSRADNHVPPRLHARYGMTYDDPMKRWGVDRHRSRLPWFVTRANRQLRHNTRADLRRGIQPEPIQPRHSVRYDWL